MNTYLFIYLIGFFVVPIFMELVNVIFANRLFVNSEGGAIIVFLLISAIFWPLAIICVIYSLTISTASSMTRKKREADTRFTLRQKSGNWIQNESGEFVDITDYSKSEEWR